MALGFPSGGPGSSGGSVSIGSAIGSGTSGSILYIDASGNLGQSNANLFFDYTNNRVGVGINSALAARVSTATTNPTGTFTRLIGGGSTVGGGYNNLSSYTSNPANATRDFYHGITITASGTMSSAVSNAFETVVTSSDSATHTGRKSCMDATVQYSGTGSASTLSGAIFQATQAGTGTVSIMYGFRGTSAISGTGAVTDAYAINAFNSVSSGATATNVYGFKLDNISNSGTITNTYGYYIGDITTGTQTNVWGFYNSDVNAPNYFAGKLGINATAPTSMLDVVATSSSTIGHIVKGAASQTANLLELQDSAAAKVLSFSAAGVITTASGNESTGAGSALLGANSPAATLTAPYKWIKFTTSDGSTVYIPCWK